MTGLVPVEDGRRRDLLASFSNTSRLIVTGQIGCGKTTLARQLCATHELAHVHIDDFHDDPGPDASAVAAVNAIDGGWVAEACVWQIPPEIWRDADFAILLDYSNWVHYRRIARRCLGSCLKGPGWSNVRRHVAGEWLHVRIMYRHADENRAGWMERGLPDGEVPVIRMSSPAQTRRAIAEMSG